MPVRILIPTPLRPFAGGASAVVVEAATLGEAVGELVTRHEGMRKHLFDGGGALRSFVNLYVNDDDARHLAKMDTVLKDGDTVSIVPSVAGGASWRG